MEGEEPPPRVEKTTVEDNAMLGGVFGLAATGKKEMMDSHPSC